MSYKIYRGNIENVHVPQSSSKIPLPLYVNGIEVETDDFDSIERTDGDDISYIVMRYGNLKTGGVVLINARDDQKSLLDKFAHHYNV